MDNPARYYVFHTIDNKTKNVVEQSDFPILLKQDVLYFRTFCEIYFGFLKETLYSDEGTPSGWHFTTETNRSYVHILERVRRGDGGTVYNQKDAEYIEHNPFWGPCDATYEIEGQYLGMPLFRFVDISKEPVCLTDQKTAEL